MTMRENLEFTKEEVINSLLQQNIELECDDDAGEWISKDDTYVCSMCEGEILLTVEFCRGHFMECNFAFSRYCPHCGARMINGGLDNDSD